MIPRVARSSQPWALGRNPFGIKHDQRAIRWFMDPKTRPNPYSDTNFPEEPRILPASAPAPRQQSTYYSASHLPEPEASGLPLWAELSPRQKDKVRRLGFRTFRNTTWSSVAAISPWSLKSTPSSASTLETSTTLETDSSGLEPKGLASTTKLPTHINTTAPPRKSLLRVAIGSVPI